MTIAQQLSTRLDRAARIAELPTFLQQIAIGADIDQNRCRIYFNPARGQVSFQRLCEGEFIMRNISTIGLISAAAALSFFCASAVHSDSTGDNVTIMAIAPAH